MQIDAFRLKRQNEVIEKWRKNGRKGTLEAVTGFGKTFVGLLIIKRLNNSQPGAKTIVIVPTNNLKVQWQAQVKEMGLHDVTVYVINTAVKSRKDCTLLILDEIHNYASAVFGTIFDIISYEAILGLTATLDRDDPRQYEVQHHAPVIDTVGLQEAVQHNYVAKFLVFNYGLRMNETEQKEYDAIQEKYYTHFAHFNNNFSTAQSVLNNPLFRSSYAKRMPGWDEQSLLNQARAFNGAMQKRKKFIYESPTKVQAAADILDLFDTKAITFSESINFTQMLAKATKHWGTAYHSRKSTAVRQRILDEFADDKYDLRIIHTARALDEGFNVDNVEMAIICSGTSKARQDLQRTGRAIRFKEGKTAIIINLYLLDTQDEKWLRKRQSKSANISWVYNIDQLYNGVHAFVRGNYASLSDWREQCGR